MPCNDVFCQTMRNALKLILVSFLLLLPLSAKPQPEQPEYLVKSAMIFKMLQYTSWPDESKLSTIRLAFVGDDNQLYNELLRAGKTIKVRGKPLIVFKTDIDSIDPQVNQVIYLDILHSQSVHKVANKSRRTGTLLLTNQSKDRHELMINFLPSRSGALAFEVNRSNIVFERLTIDRDLLLLGGTEIDVAELFRETELALQQLKQEQFEWEQKLKVTNETLQKEQQEVSRQKALNRDFLTQVRSREQQLLQKSDELNALNNDVQQVNQQLDSKQQELAQREAQFDNQIKRTNDQSVKVAFLNAQIVEKQAVLADQQKKLENMIKEMDTQKGTMVSQQKALYLVLGALFIFTLLIIYSLSVNASRKRTNRRLENFQNNMVALGGIGRDLTANLDLNRIMDQLHQSLNQVLDAHVFFLGIIDKDNRYIEVPLLVEKQQKIPPMRISLNDNKRPSVCCVKQQKEVVINNTTQWQEQFGIALPASSLGDQMSTMVYLPLIIGDKIVGCLSIQSPEPNAYNDEQLEMVRLLSRYIAIAVSNAQGYAELQQQKRKSHSQNQQVQAAQKQLAQAEKMARLGSHAKSVRDELNDPANYTHTAAYQLGIEIEQLKSLLIELAGGDNADPELIELFNTHFAKLKKLNQSAHEGSGKIIDIIEQIDDYDGNVLSQQPLKTG